MSDQYGLSDILKYKANSSDVFLNGELKKNKMVWPLATMKLKLYGPAYELDLCILKMLAFQDTNILVDS
jgi:hypothetical protein